VSTPLIAVTDHAAERYYRQRVRGAPARTA
jgi:hypothetical protein